MEIYIIVYMCVVTTIVNTETLERLRRQPVCGDHQYLTENNGEIISHTGYNVGNNYGKNLDCVWKIEAPEGLNVLLTPIEFQLESDESCSWDYLELFDGPGVSAPSLGIFCGDTLEKVSSTQRFLTLQFKTDGVDTRPGFKLFYNFTDEVIHHCLASQFQCNNSKCIVNDFVCDTDDDCGDNSDEMDCQVDPVDECGLAKFYCEETDTCICRFWLCDGDNDCGDGADEIPSNCVLHGNSASCAGEANVTDTEGSITSPRWPQNYTNNTRCIYYIQGPEGTQEMLLSFNAEFSLEWATECRFDFITITDDLDEDPNKYGTFCGEESPGNVTITGDHAYLLFRSDESNTSGGFSIEWTAI